MRHYEVNQWHTWESVSGYLLSDESKKELTSHKTLDDVVNYIYLRDKDSARKLNQLIKGKQ